MAPKNKPLFSTTTAPPAPLTFRRDVLLQPPPDQLSLHDDSVGSRVRDIDAAISSMASRVGLQMLDFGLNDPPKPFGNATADVLQVLTLTQDRLSVTRHGEKWGIWWTHIPSVVESLAGQSMTRARITDAPLPIRKQFLHKSEMFVRQYFKLCEDKLGDLKAAADAGDRTLALLANVLPR